MIINESFGQINDKFIHNRNQRIGVQFANKNWNVQLILLEVNYVVSR